MKIRKDHNPRTAEVFTTSQIAAVCVVAPRTVSKWCDSGKLRHYLVPGTKHRRVSREQFERFLREYKMECFLPAITPLPVPPIVPELASA